MKIDWTKVKEGFTTMDVIKEENKELKEEIERLNNIINELEKWLVEQSEKVWDDNNYLDDVIDKLGELKGEDKE